MRASIAESMQCYQRALSRAFVANMEYIWSGGLVLDRINARFDRCCHGRRKEAKG